MMREFEKIVLVRRKTRLEELLVRFGTRDQARFYLEHLGVSFKGYAEEHATYMDALERVRRALPRSLRLSEIERDFLPTYTFTEHDLVMVVGQDGLVVNCAKYLADHPVIAINPDPARLDGVLLPFAVSDAGEAMRAVLEGRMRIQRITMASAQLNDGQHIDAVNDLFVGISSHASARYDLAWQGRRESQSSSGVIVSTGAGSTGWYRSILTGSAGIVTALGGGAEAYAVRDRYRFDWEARELRFCVREPFISRHSDADICCGTIDSGESLQLISQMPADGVIFGDGVISDALSFCSGAIATISVADRCLHLVTAA
jgi:NAD kinase